jgi:hypothetical protein
VDLIEISGGSYEAPAMVGLARHSTVAREAYFLDAAEKLRQVTKVPLMLTGGMRTAAAMQNAVASGAVDVVGLARPMAVEPELPGQVLAGSAVRAAEIDIATPWKRINSLLEIYWYQLQLERMGDGLDPARNTSRIRALFHAAGVSFTNRASKSAQLTAHEVDVKAAA